MENLKESEFTYLKESDYLKQMEWVGDMLT
jgi:hypothetical protein